MKLFCKSIQNSRNKALDKLSSSSKFAYTTVCEIGTESGGVRELQFTQGLTDELGRLLSEILR